MNEEKIDYKRIILMTVAATGLLAIAILAPNAIQILKPLIKNKKSSNLKYYLDRKTKKLIEEGFIKIETSEGKQFLSLSEKGERQLAYYKIKEKKELRWDKKWRVVVFDVWENSRVKRNLLRNEIKDYGFVQLQRSVWIYPYECAEFIELLKTDLSFGKNIRYMVVEKLDYDNALRKQFKLK